MSSPPVDDPTLAAELQRDFSLPREGVAAFGPDLRCHYWNPGMEALTGLAADFVTDLPADAVRTAFHRLGWLPLLERALAGEAAVGRPRAVGGLLRPLELSVAPTAPAPRFDVRVMATARVVADAGSPKRHDELLELLTTAVGALDEGVVITDGRLEPPGPQVVFVNDAVTRITGYPVAELMDRPPTPAAEPGLRTWVREVLAATPPGAGRVDQQRRDGSRYLLDWQATPIFAAAAARPSHFLAVLRDATKSRLASQMIEEKERFARAVLDSLADHISVLDAQGTILAVNEAWEQFALANSGSHATRVGVGLNYLEVSRRSLGADAPDAAEVEAALAGIQAVLDRQLLRFSVEYPCHAPTQQRWFLMIVTPLFQDQGGAVIAHMDVTERRLAADARVRLIEQLLTAQEDERRRVALDLHDEIGQALTALLVGLANAESAPTAQATRQQLPALRAMTAETLDAVRRLARGLRPAALDHLGLLAALERYAADFVQAHGIQVALRFPPAGTMRLPNRIELALYRIIQEALTNVARHAHASQILITFTPSEREWTLTVQDDGRGFDAGAAPGTGKGKDARHVGLYGMTERARLLGGRLDVRSAPTAGTTLHVTIPRAEGQP